MNKEETERIKDLKDIFNKKLENYELDKKFGQLSIDSIYSLFPTDIKLLLDYINQLETNRDEAIKFIETHSFIDEHLPFANALGPINVKKLLEILERGKE